MPADKVQLDRPFKITCKKCGGDCELDQHETPPMANCERCGDLERDEFVATCPNCGNTSPEFDNGVRRGSSWTGPYGSYEVRCPCGNVEVVYEP